MVDFCAQHNIPYELCGKLVVATKNEEIPRLRDLMERGTANGVAGLQWLEPGQIREYEPHAAGLAAIRVPQEGIVDYPAVAEALVREIRELGGDIQFSSEVIKLRESSGWVIHTAGGDYEADFIVNCAGLHCDRVSAMAGNHDPTKIVPFRGEYYKLKPERSYLVHNLIYPVPNPKFPFLGVHFTRLIHGGVEAGPNAVLALAREGYRSTDFSLRDFIDTATYRGFWRFLLRYPSMCGEEVVRSCSKALFCRSLQQLVPEIETKDLTQGGAGVRAQALSPSGELVQDFYIVRQAKAIHVLNAPSPAATACLAIADEIINFANGAFSADKKCLSALRELEPNQMLGTKR
jgi:L-2-hydroxyglutarate oxidase LhgO